MNNINKLKLKKYKKFHEHKINFLFNRKKKKLIKKFLNCNLTILRGVDQLVRSHDWGS